MASITFKGKIETAHYADDSIAYQYIRLPKLARGHCDMRAFRNHPKFGGFANSDMFQNVLSRISRDTFKGRDRLRLDEVPECVVIDTSGFLASVTIEV